MNIRNALLAIFTLVSPIMVSAQATIPVSGNKVVDNNGTPLTGRLVFTVTDVNDRSVTYTPQGGTVTNATFIIPTLSGVVQNVGGSPPAIANPATMTPANTRYRIQVESTDGTTTYFTFPLVNINQNSFSYDAYSVTSNPAAHTLAAANLQADNPSNTPNIGAHLDSVSDYVVRDSQGVIANHIFPQAIPWHMTQTVNQRYGPAGGYTPLSLNLNLFSGQDNTNVVQGNYGGLVINTKALTPLQGGGMFAIESKCYAVGDCVGKTMNLLGRGVSRGEDEGTESPRNFLAPTNDVAGGMATFLATDAQGNQPITTTTIPKSGYSQNFYEKSFLIDVSKKWQSPGNIASLGTSPDVRFSQFNGDSSSGLTAHLGVSTQTALTQPIDNYVYTGPCPTHINTKVQYPVSGNNVGGNDAFITNYKGVGAPGENTNYDEKGAIVGFCAQVASTSGMSDGTLLFIADSDYQVEFTRVIKVIDSTHFTAFFRQPHSIGATINFGGGVGNCIGADADISPPGTNSTTGNPQYATQRLCYPIVQSLASNIVTVYTNIEGGSPNNLRTLIPASNTPKVPLKITSPVVVAGVLTGFTVNDTAADFNNYVSNYTGAANSGHPRALPAPAVTVSGCKAAPVIGMKSITFGASSVTYVPYIVDGGSGCETVTFNIPATFPTPFGTYPMAMIYKSEDPFAPPGSIDGKFLLMPFNTSAMKNGDELMAPDWWNGLGVSGQTTYNGNYLNALAGRNGHMILHRFSGVANGYAYEAWLNGEPTSHYYGTFANNYTYKSLGDYLVQPPIWHIAVGQYRAGFLMSSPPLATQAGTIIGGAVISVECGTDTLSKTTVNPPCLHGINPQYDLFRSTPGATSKRMNIFVDNATGTMGIGGQSVTWRAPTLTAYDPVAATADVALFGTSNGGVGKGPCQRFDLLDKNQNYLSSNGRICGFLDAPGGSFGDLQFQVNNGHGPASYTTALSMKSDKAIFSVPVASTVATGTAPFSVTSTTVVPNLNASLLGGIALSGICQANGTGCPTIASGPLPASFTSTAAAFDDVTVRGMTPAGHCSVTATNSAAASNIATVYVSRKIDNGVRVAHASIAGLTYDLICTPN
jgi:hypothetical protein